MNPSGAGIEFGLIRTKVTPVFFDKVQFCYSA